MPEAKARAQGLLTDICKPLSRPRSCAPLTHVHGGKSAESSPEAIEGESSRAGGAKRPAPPLPVEADNAAGGGVDTTPRFEIPKPNAGEVVVSAHPLTALVLPNATKDGVGFTPPISAAIGVPKTLPAEANGGLKGGAAATPGGVDPEKPPELDTDPNMPPAPALVKPNVPPAGAAGAGAAAVGVAAGIPKPKAGAPALLALPDTAPRPLAADEGGAAPKARKFT